MIVGVGVDIIEIGRIEAALERHGQRFLSRLLTAQEQRSWAERGSRAESLAGYWAVKEAVAKSLGTGLHGFSLRDMVVFHSPAGQPQVELVKGAQLAAENRGITKIWISISHSRQHAVAQAIACQ